MKVMHVVREFSPPSQTFIYDLIINLEASGVVENDVVFYKKRFLQDERPYKRLRSVGEIERQELFKLERLLLKLRKKNKKLIAFERYVKKINPDVIHCHFSWCLWEFLEGVDFSVIGERPLLVSVHGTDVTWKVKEGRNLELFREFSKKNNVYFSGTSKFLSSVLGGLGVDRSKIFIIPNAVNLSFTKPQGVVSEKIKPDAYGVCCNARFIKQKGHFYLIHAFRRFVDEVNAHAELNLIGDGVLYQEMKELVDRLGIRDRVNFLGALPHADIPSVLRAQDVYVQPSITDINTGQVEAFGVAVLEALSTGLPVIVTNTGGLPWVVSGGGEVVDIVQEQSVEALFEALKSNYDTPKCKKQVCEFGAKKAEEFSQDRQLEACLHAYNSVLSVVKV